MLNFYRFLQKLIINLEVICHWSFLQECGLNFEITKIQPLQLPPSSLGLTLSDYYNINIKKIRKTVIPSSS